MTSPTSRRRMRGWRLTVAAVTLIVAVLVAVAAVIVGDLTFLMAGCGTTAVLAVVGSRLIYDELVETRVVAGADRAHLARIYRDLSEKRSEQNAEFISLMDARFVAAQYQLQEFEVELDAARLAVYEAELESKRQRQRADLAEGDLAQLADELTVAEARVEEALLKVSEAEAELDVLRAELESWEALNQARPGADAADAS